MSQLDECQDTRSWLDEQDTKKRFEKKMIRKLVERWWKLYGSRGTCEKLRGSRTKVLWC